MKDAIATTANLITMMLTMIVVVAVVLELPLYGGLCAKHCA